MTTCPTPDEIEASIHLVPDHVELLSSIRACHLRALAARLRELEEENAALRDLLRETRMYALGQDCSTMRLKERIDERLAAREDGDAAQPTEDPQR